MSDPQQLTISPIRLLNLSAEEEVNDGAVPEPSVRGVYHERHVTFSIPPLTYEPIQSFAATPTSCNSVALDHLRIKQETAAVEWIVDILKGRPITIGSCDSPAAATASAAQGSSAPLQSIDSGVGAVGTGETAQLTIPCDAKSSLKVVASRSTGSVPVTLLDPSGSPVSPSDTESDPPIELYDIASPASGNWSLNFDGSSLPAGTADYAGPARINGQYRRTGAIDFDRLFLPHTRRMERRESLAEGVCGWASAVWVRGRRLRFRDVLLFGTLRPLPTLVISATGGTCSWMSSPLPYAG